MFMALLWSTAPLTLPGGTSCWHMKVSDRIIQAHRVSKCVDSRLAGRPCVNVMNAKFIRCELGGSYVELLA